MESTRDFMSTVNISFDPDLLKKIDKVAGKESHSRSELIRERQHATILKRSVGGGRSSKLRLRLPSPKDLRLKMSKRKSHPFGRRNESN
jgi:hypothetical protein